MKVGIAGLGLSAQHFHIPLLQCFEDVEIVSVFTSKTETEVAQLLPESPLIFEGFQDFVENNSYELAVVLTPNQYHFEMVDSLLAAGRHVLVDKPLAVSSEQLQQLLKRQNQSGKILSVFHNRRFDSDFLTVKQAIEQNTSGAISWFESRFDKYRPSVFGRWREQDIEGAGLLFDIGSHLIDQMVLLFGEPLSLQSDVRKSRPEARVEDEFSILCFYENFRVQLRTSSLAARTPYRFYVEAADNTIIQHGFDSQEARLAEGYRNTDEDCWLTEPVDGWCSVFSGSSQSTLPPVNGDYRNFYRQLFLAIETSSEDYVGIDAAIAVQKIIDAARLSHQTGKRITLS